VQENAATRRARVGKEREGCSGRRRLYTTRRTSRGMTDFHDNGGNERRRHGKKRRGPKEELEPNKLHGVRLASHRNKLESTCPVEDALSASADGWRGFVEVATSEELENVFATSGLDKICVHRMGSRSKSDVFRTLHMSYPVQTLEEFKTRLARFVHEELTIPTIDVRTQSDGQPLNVIDVVKYFSEPAAKRKAILNITSFNLAHTGLDGLVVAPQIVRDLDLVSRVWPSQRMIRFYVRWLNPSCRVEHRVAPDEPGAPSRPLASRISLARSYYRTISCTTRLPLWRR